MLINNAAFTGDTDLEGWQGRFEEQTIDAWEAALTVNLSQHLNLPKSVYHF